MKFEDILGIFRQLKFNDPFTSNKIYNITNNLELYYYYHEHNSNTWILGNNNVLYLYTNDCILLDRLKRDFDNETHFNFATCIYLDDVYYIKRLLEDNKELLKQKRREIKINKLGI